MVGAGWRTPFWGASPSGSSTARPARSWSSPIASADGGIVAVVKVPRRLPRSQVSLTTVFTICFGVLVSVAVVLFVTHSLVAITITAGALMIAVALDHLVALLVERKVKRIWAIVIVTAASLALL